MAISTPTVLIENFSTTNAQTYSTAAFTPAASALLIVAFTVNDVDDPGTMNISTTLSGVTWVERINQPADSVTLTDRLKIWTGTGAAASSGTVTVDGMPDACTGAMWKVVQVATGWDTGTPIVQTVGHNNAANVTTETLTFAAYGSAGNGVVAFAVKGGTTVFVLSTESSNWTALGTDQQLATPNRRMVAAYDLSATDTTINWTWSTATIGYTAGVEVKASVAATVTPPKPIINLQAVERAANY